MDIPRYLVIRQALETKINNGILKPGSRVPSESEISIEFAVSRMTARRALVDLDNAGLIARSPGKGSFVKSKLDKPTLISVPSPSLNFSDSSTVTLKVLDLKETPSDQRLQQDFLKANEFSMIKGVFLYNNGVSPERLQYVYVLPEYYSAFIKQKFSKISPEGYLEWSLPSDTVSKNIQAVTLRASEIHYLEDFEKNDHASLLMKERRITNKKVTSVIYNYYLREDFIIGDW